MSFRSEEIDGILVWSGAPDCDAACERLGEHIARAGNTKIPANRTLTNSQIGNLGEALAYLVGRSGPHPEPDHRLLAENCRNPLAGGSKTGLDILWLAFHPTNAELDVAWIQEVKTTVSTETATYIASLKGDYEKLFGTVRGLSLEERLGDAAFLLENLAAAPDLARRTRALGARTASAVTQVVLSPTGVHDLGVSALEVMNDVKDTLVTKIGWPDALVEPHLIAISDLKNRLRRLVE